MQNQMKKVVLIALIIMNLMVMAGQIWPAATPPFAHKVNLTFLILSLSYFLVALLKVKK